MNSLGHQDFLQQGLSHRDTRESRDSFTELWSRVAKTLIKGWDGAELPAALTLCWGMPHPRARLLFLWKLHTRTLQCSGVTQFCFPRRRILAVSSSFQLAGIFRFRLLPSISKFGAKTFPFPPPELEAAASQCAMITTIIITTAIKASDSA